MYQFILDWQKGQKSMDSDISSSVNCYDSDTRKEKQTHKLADRTSFLKLLFQWKNKYKQ